MLGLLRALTASKSCIMLQQKYYVTLQNAVDDKLLEKTLNYNWSTVLTHEKLKK